MPRTAAAAQERCLRRQPRSAWVSARAHRWLGARGCSTRRSCRSCRSSRPGRRRQPRPGRAAAAATRCPRRRCSCSSSSRLSGARGRCRGGGDVRLRINHRTKAQLRGLAELLDERVLCQAGHRDHDDRLVASPLRCDLRFGDTGSVHACGDDLDGLVDRVVGYRSWLARKRLRDQRDGGPALQVEAELDLGGVLPGHPPAHSDGNDQQHQQGAPRPPTGGSCHEIPPAQF